MNLKRLKQLDLPVAFIAGIIKIHPETLRSRIKRNGPELTSKEITAITFKLNAMLAKWQWKRPTLTTEHRDSNN